MLQIHEKVKITFHGLWFERVDFRRNCWILAFRKNIVLIAGNKSLFMIVFTLDVKKTLPNDNFNV